MLASSNRINSYLCQERKGIDITWRIQILVILPNLLTNHVVSPWDVKFITSWMHFIKLRTTTQSNYTWNRCHEIRAYVIQWWIVSVYFSTISANHSCSAKPRKENWVCKVSISVDFYAISCHNISGQTHYEALALCVYTKMKGRSKPNCFWFFSSLSPFPLPNIIILKRVSYSSVFTSWCDVFGLNDVISCNLQLYNCILADWEGILQLLP